MNVDLEMSGFFCWCFIVVVSWLDFVTDYLCSNFVLYASFA